MTDIILAFVAGGGIQYLFGRFLTYKSKSKQSTDDRYDALVTRLETRIESLEKQNTACHDGRLEDKRELGELQGRVNTLMEIVQQWNIS